MITRSPLAALTLLATVVVAAPPTHADPPTALPPAVRVGETYLVVIGPGSTPMTIEELDAASGWARVSSERPEIDGGWVNLGQAMMIRPLER